MASLAYQAAGLRIYSVARVNAEAMLRIEHARAWAILHGDFTSERVGSTTRRLHQRVRLAILYRIDTWYVL